LLLCKCDVSLQSNEDRWERYEQDDEHWDMYEIALKFEDYLADKTIFSDWSVLRVFRDDIDVYVILAFQALLEGTAMGNLEFVFDLRGVGI
jgi:hypothetical protein